MIDRVLIRGGTVVAPEGARDDTDVLIEDGRVVALGRALPGDGAGVVDARGRLVAPGLVDIHVHGADGAMFEDGRADRVRRILRALPRYGTTGVLATLAALPVEPLRAAVAAIAAVEEAPDGARLLGIHLEGPFLNPRRCGAQRPDWMRAPALDEIDALQQSCGGRIRLVTLAPELPGALDLIRGLRQRGIAVALGHSDADDASVLDAVEAGAAHVTHLFNAMPALHHRAPMLAGVALTDDRLSVELIGDGVHLHPRAVDLAIRCKTPERVALVSDAVAALGLAAGERELFGTRCVVGDAVRVAASGQLAGSCHSLDRALRHLRVCFPELAVSRLLGMATAVPAAVAGVAATAGAIEPGRIADLVLLSPALEVCGVLRAGRLLPADARRPHGT